jgi:hypothetical protein
MAALAAAVVALSVLGGGVGYAAGKLRGHPAGGGPGDTGRSGGHLAARSASPTVDTSCGAFREDFTSALLDSAWSRDYGQFIEQERIDQGWLELSVKDGADLYPGYLQPPMYTRKVTGSYALYAKLHADPQYWYQGAGLVLFVDTNTYVRLERGVGTEGGGAIGFEYRVAGGEHAKPADPGKRQYPTDATDVELRMLKSGTEVTGAWRPAGTQQWQEVGTAKISPDAAYRSGILALNRSQPPTPLSKKGVFTARFDYVQAVCT